MGLALCRCRSFDYELIFPSPFTSPMHILPFLKQACSENLVFAVKLINQKLDVLAAFTGYHSCIAKEYKVYHSREEVWLARKDADHYLSTIFSRLMVSLHPDVVVLLGDIFSDGFRASANQWSDYLTVREPVQCVVCL